MEESTSEITSDLSSDDDSSDEPPFDIFSRLNQYVSQPTKDSKSESKPKPDHKHREKEPSKKTDPSSSKTSHDTEKRRISKVLNPVVIENSPLNNDAGITFESISKLPYTTTSISPVAQEQKLRTPLMKKTPLKQKLRTEKPSKIIEPPVIADYDADCYTDSIHSHNIKLVPAFHSAIEFKTPPRSTEEVVAFEKIGDTISNSPSDIPLPYNSRPSVVKARKLKSPNETSLETPLISSTNGAFGQIDHADSISTSSISIPTLSPFVLQAQQLHTTNTKPHDFLNIARTNLQRKLESHREKKASLKLYPSSSKTDPSILNPVVTKTSPTNTDLFKSILKLQPSKPTVPSAITDYGADSDTDSIHNIEHVPTVHSTTVEIETPSRSTEEVVTFEEIEDTISNLPSVIPIPSDIRPSVVQTPNKTSHETSNMGAARLQLNRMEQQLKNLNLPEFDVKVNLPRFKPLQDSVIKVSPNTQHAKNVATAFLNPFNSPAFSQCPSLPQTSLSSPLTSAVISPPQPARPAPALLQLSPLQSRKMNKTRPVVRQVSAQNSNFRCSYTFNVPTVTLTGNEDILGDILDLEEDLKAMSVRDKSTEKYSTNKATATVFEDVCRLCDKEKNCHFCDSRNKNKDVQTDEERKIAEIERELRQFSAECLSSSSVKKATGRGRPSKKTTGSNSEKSKPASRYTKKSKPPKEHPATGDMMLKQILESSPKPLRKRTLPP